MFVKFQITFLVAVVFALASCNDSKNSYRPNIKFNKKKKNPGLIIGDPLDCGLDNLTIFPVGCSYNPEIIEPERKNFAKTGIELRSSSISFNANTVTYSDAAYDSNAKVEFVNENDDDFDIRNILFYNLLTGESYPLVDDSVHILSFALHKEFELPLIFYRVVKEDYNKDGKYNGFDPVMLYVSELDGTNFQQITPPNEYFIDYDLYTQTNSILIKTAIDSNKDLAFLSDDETNFRTMKLNAPAPAKNIFDDKMKDALRNLN